MTRLTVDELEMLNPEELGELLRYEGLKDPPDLQYIQDILTVGCPIDARDNAGRTALHWATRNEKIEALRFLISKGADIHARDEDGWTPLHIAVWIEKLEVVEFLISSGADIHARDIHGWIALHDAAQKGQLEVVKLLIFKGVDINVRNNDGRTAWDLATACIRKSYPELELK